LFDYLRVNAHRRVRQRQVHQEQFGLRAETSVAPILQRIDFGGTSPLGARFGVFDKLSGTSQ
jgi:hypothetical protein